MTHIDLVREYFPNATDGECDCILWELTCFPLCSAEMVEAQIVELTLERELVLERGMGR